MSNHLRAWLTQELDRRGWSQGELARRSGVSRPLVTRTLSGDMLPSADFCIKVAQALEESPEKMLRIAGILPALQTDSPILTEIVDLIKNLPADTQQDILEYVRFRYQQRRE